MELAAVTFIFGGLLLSIGLFGGGFQVKEVTIPQVSKSSCFLATL